MSQYQGRRPPSVSQYLANLNTIPPATEGANAQDFTNFEDDLAMFTNTQFFDFDVNEPVPDLTGETPSFTAGQSRQGQGLGNSPKNMGFVNQSNFPYEQFGPYPQGPVLRPSPNNSLPPSPPNGVPFNNAAQQSQPTVPNAAAFAMHMDPSVGEKRRATQASLPSAVDLEEASRNAAEEDKRRRNTAASARFRVKKKQREQALEKTAKDMSEKVSILEGRVGQLEMENKWLKGIILEKNLKFDSSTSPAAVASKKEAEKAKDVAVVDEAKDTEADDEQRSSADKEEDERSTEERTDGVGTLAEAVEA